jgi:pepF/M3 family oligoendopeptidase
MDYNWNLEPIYPSFKSEAYQADIARIEALTLKLNDECPLWKDSKNPLQTLELIIKDTMEIYETIQTVLGYASLKFTVNTSDAEAISHYEKAEQMITELTKPDVAFTRFVGSLDNLDQLIAQSSLLQEHRFYPNRQKERCQYMLSEEEEVLIAKLMTTGSSSWSMLQSKLTSKLMVSVKLADGVKEVTLSEARAMACEDALDVRKAAYEAELLACENIDEAVATALNSIKGEVLTTSERRGFTSPLEEALFKTKMSQKTLDALIGAIEEYLPKVRQYYKKKGQLLGDENGIRFYNLFAPIGTSSKKYTHEESMSFIIENFNSFSTQMGDYANKAYTNCWIDVEPKAGKVGGAYCAEVPKTRESRILLNFKGSLGDVITTAHELGHGYHNEMLRDASILNVDVPMPLAETASTFCETIVGRAALKTVGPEEQITVLESALQDAGQCIADIYSRFLFESRLFEQRKNGSVSVEDMKNLMLQAQLDAYGDGMDPEYRHPYMWLNKGHYYSAGLNFYNFPYAFGLLFAKGLYKLYQLEGDTFLERYNKLLAFTGQDTIENVCASVVIDVTSKEFWRNSLDVIVEDIDAFIALCDNK